MTRLTNSTRDSIINAAIHATFEKRFKDIVAEEETVALTLYKAAFPAQELKDAKKLPDRWLRLDKCLKFNCGGYNLYLRIETGVRVPHNGGDCGRLASFSAGDPMADLGQKFAEKKDALEKEREAAKREIKVLLYSVGTMKQLKEAWPQGEKFYKRFDVAPDVKTGLPAIQVDSLNKMLGL